VDVPAGIRVGGPVCHADIFVVVGEDGGVAEEAGERSVLVWSYLVQGGEV
jgi:hypothetical protein